MLIFTGFYAFYGACLVIASTAFPGWATIYLSPTTLGSITMIITFGFAGGFTGAFFASRGDPFWTVSGGLAGVIGVSAGADVYAPVLGYLIAMLTAVLAVYVGNWIEGKMRVDDVVGAVAVHGVSGFLGVIWVGVFAAGYPTGVNNVDSSIGGQLIGVATFLPLGFLSGYVASWVLRKLNLLRVPRVGRDRRPRRRRVPARHLRARVRPCAGHAHRARRDAPAGRRGAGRRAGCDQQRTQSPRRTCARLVERTCDARNHQQRARLRDARREGERRRHGGLHPPGQLPGLRGLHDVRAGQHLRRRGRGGGDQLLRADRDRRSGHGRGVPPLDPRREPGAREVRTRTGRTTAQLEASR